MVTFSLQDLYACKQAQLSGLKLQAGRITSSRLRRELSLATVLICSFLDTSHPHPPRTDRHHDHEPLLHRKFDKIL